MTESKVPYSCDEFLHTANYFAVLCSYVKLHRLQLIVAYMYSVQRNNFCISEEE
jgi:hypothetical protein